MGYNSKTQTFDTSSELRTREGRNGSSVFVLGYYEAGDIGQTLLYTYSNSSTLDDDGGIVFKPDSIDPGDPGRWILQYSQPINVLWFGLKATVDAFDNLELFNKMVAAAPNIPTQPTTGYNLKGSFIFPRSSYTYYFSGTIDMYDTVTLLGEDGSDIIMGTVFQFPTDTIGIHVHPTNDITPSKGAFSFSMFNIKLQSSLGTDTTKAGFKASRPFRLDNCDITGFSGGGILVDTTVEGIADLFYCVNCSVYYNGESGIITKGVDSNQGTIINLNAFGNKRWGVDERSFLGNQYFGCHTNVNSNVPGNPVWAFLSGVTYACTKDHANIQPGVASGWQDYWIVIVTGIVAPTAEYPAWNSSFAYKTGGAYNSVGLAPGVNASNWFGCYSEGGQPPSAFDGSNVVYGGAHGAGFRSPRNMGFIGGSGGLFSTSQFWWRIPQALNVPATQEVVIHENGIELFPSNNEVRGGGLAFQWVENLKLFAYQYRGSEYASWITTPDTDPSWYGRVVAPFPVSHFITGILLTKNNDYPRARLLEFSDSEPTSGYHAVGDVALRTLTGPRSPGDTVFGWACTVAGTPGTFEELVTGTATVVDGTPSNTVTPTGWFKTSIEGVDAWLPYYQ